MDKIPTEGQALAMIIAIMFGGTLLLNMICKRGKMYNKKFDRVYLFSPSLGSIDDCPFEDLPDDQKYEEL